MYQQRQQWDSSDLLLQQAMPYTFYCPPLYPQIQPMNVPASLAPLLQPQMADAAQFIPNQQHNARATASVPVSPRRGVKRAHP